MAHLNGRAACSKWLELPKSMCSGRMQPCDFLVERPNKNSLPGVAVLRNHFSSYQSALVQCTNMIALELRCRGLGRLGGAEPHTPVSGFIHPGILVDLTSALG